MAPILLVAAEFCLTLGMAVQLRYAAGTKEVLRRYFEGEELNPTDVIVSVSLHPVALRACSGV